MAMIGKELEQGTSLDELATKEVEGYIERIEHQAETKLPTQTTTASTQTTATMSDAAAKQAVALAPKSGKQTIVLPLDEDGVMKGLHHKVWEAIRWLAEWSVYMIKKYPGRVFYPAKQDDK